MDAVQVYGSVLFGRVAGSEVAAAAAADHQVAEMLWSSARAAAANLMELYHL